MAMKKFLGLFFAVIVVVRVLFVGVRYYYVFGEGVKAGQLNYVVKKGFIFKTYEGKLIQTGLKSDAPNSLQSNEFIFSIENAPVAEKLMLSSGREVMLHYKEYLGAVALRGFSKFVGDSGIKNTGGVADPGGFTGSGRLPRS